MIMVIYPEMVIFEELLFLNNYQRMEVHKISRDWVYYPGLPGPITTLQTTELHPVPNHFLDKKILQIKLF